MKIGQIRFYKRDDPRNNVAISDLYSSSGSAAAFSSYYPIVQLGIQSLPGVQFYVNNGLEPITIGTNGIYEVNLEGFSEISSLTFDKASIAMVNKDENSYIIVDILSEGE